MKYLTWKSPVADKAGINRPGVGWGGGGTGKNPAERESPRLLSSYSNNSNNPRAGTDQLRGA
jgi:hypothetical protein